MRADINRSHSKINICIPFGLDIAYNYIVSSFFSSHVTHLLHKFTVTLPEAKVAIFFLSPLISNSLIS
jgi:hypothetical protein